jgi:hypothetical protein
MFYQRISSLFLALALVVCGAVAAFGAGANKEFPTDKTSTRERKVQVSEPLTLAVLVQDDLISQVGNELGVTRDFIRSLPAGSRVMVGYITTGSLQVRQSFTSDLDKAARSLRLPRASTSASAYNPYVEVIEALRLFDENGKGKNAVLLISDGLDTSRGFDVTSAAHTVDLERSIAKANQRGVTVYAFLCAFSWLDEPQPFSSQLRAELIEPARARHWRSSVFSGNHWFRNFRFLFQGTEANAE